jgi:hypothetical protein
LQRFGTTSLTSFEKRTSLVTGSVHFHHNFFWDGFVVISWILIFIMPSLPNSFLWNSSSYVPPWCYSQTGFPKWLNPATVAVIHTWEIWLQVREDSRHFLESCYVLATSKNPASKYGDFHVFLLRTWSFSTVRKKRCSVDFAQKNLAGWINGQDCVGEFQVVEVPPVPIFFSRLDSGQ